MCSQTHRTKTADIHESEDEFKKTSSVHRQHKGVRDLSIPRFVNSHARRSVRKFLVAQCLEEGCK